MVATPNITVSLEDAVRTLEKSVEGLQYREETLEVVKSVEQERQSGGSPLRSAISGTLPAETWSEGPEKPKVLFALISKKGLRLYTDESMPKALYPDPGDDTQLHPCIKSLEKPSILQALVLWQSTGGGGEISCITGTLTKGMSGAPIFARSRPSGFGGPVPASTLGIV